MTNTTEDTIDERQGEVEDLSKACESILESLGCAESCETPEDFDANIDEALAEARSLVKAIEALRS
jgi:ElaB/YqjD/DUF883 family membrane-anchored ribosome-binding protein